MKTTYILPIAASAMTLMLAGCGSSRHQPEAVAAANPTITYKYHGEDELLQASNNASTYCSQYKAAPRTVRIERNSDPHVVVFECLPVGAVTTVQQNFTPGTPYTYHSDEELLDSSRNARSYCVAHGGQPVETITTAPDGTRSVAYSCK